MPAWTFARDLDDTVASVGNDWEMLRGARVFMTGGTGFIGRWMLEALAVADRQLKLGCEVVVLTRDPAAFASRAPHLANHVMYRFVEGDVLEPPMPDGAFSHVIHAATDASADLNLNQPVKMFDTVVDGTRRALDIAVAKNVSRFFYLSSGAVYGAQPWDVTHVTEAWRGAPDCTDPRNAYAEAKRAAEMLCAIYAKQHGVDVVIARIFALLGPLLSLDIHFAAGNFIRDAIAGRPVIVEGSGKAVRSYLYAADLTAWLWTIMVRAKPGAVYNVGSEDAISIGELAAKTAALLGNAGHRILGQPDPGWNPGRYVPSSRVVQSELGLTAKVDLDQAILRTAYANGWGR